MRRRTHLCVGLVAVVAATSCSSSKERIAENALAFGGFEDAQFVVEHAESRWVGFDPGYFVVVSLPDGTLTTLLTESGFDDSAAKVEIEDIPDSIYDFADGRNFGDVWSLNDSVVVDSNTRYRDVYYTCADDDCVALISVYAT